MSSAPFKEVLPKKGLLFTESQPQLTLCKPKLLPLKSVTLLKMEKMQKEAKERAMEEARKAQMEEEKERNDRTSAKVQSESVSFE